MPSINNFLTGFSDGLPGMKDYRHASKLYIDDNFKLLPKQKFLFYVNFKVNPEVTRNDFTRNEQIDLNMLVKTCDLPKYNMNVEEKIQYNKKMYTATRIAYEPVNITFHDDMADTVNAFWKNYYEYNIADTVGLGGDGNPANPGAYSGASKDDYYDPTKLRKVNKYGMDTPKRRRVPYLIGIDIYVLHKKKFTLMSLVNPVIGSFAHDNLDQTDGQGMMQNTMQILYEGVQYRAGNVVRGDPVGFAELRYDKEPSPLSVLGGGTTSIFGPGGVVDGIGSVIRSVGNKNYLRAILEAANTYKNAKKIKKKHVKEELKGVGKQVLGATVAELGNAGISSPVGNFTVGGIAAGVAAVGVVTLAKERKDVTGTNNTIIESNNQDTVNFLTANESYNLVTNNDAIKDEIAAGIYFKDIGSRTGKTVAQSNLEYANASDSTKNVYKSKAVTNVRKLVTEGYIKINRTTQDVQIVTEKANV